MTQTLPIVPLKYIEYGVYGLLVYNIPKSHIFLLKGDCMFITWMGSAWQFPFVLVDFVTYNVITVQRV